LLPLHAVRRREGRGLGKRFLEVAYGVPGMAAAKKGDERGHNIKGEGRALL